MGTFRQAMLGFFNRFDGFMYYLASFLTHSFRLVDSPTRW